MGNAPLSKKQNYIHRKNLELLKNKQDNDKNVSSSSVLKNNDDIECLDYSISYSDNKIRTNTSTGFNDNDIDTLEYLSSKGELSFEYLESFMSIPFFEDLDHKSLRRLSCLFKRITYDKNTYIIKEGNKDDSFYMIISGNVMISAKDENTNEIYELYTLSNGKWFGETALMCDSLQPVSVHTIEKTTVLSLMKSEYVDFLKENMVDSVKVSVNGSNETDIFSSEVSLTKLPFFRDVPQSKLRKLAMMFEFRRCESRQIICREGEKAEGFFILARGTVGCSTSIAATDSNEEHNDFQLNVLKAGDWFGEMALILNTNRTATIRSIQPCLLLYLSADRFRSFLKLCPEVRASGYFDQIISQRTANSLKALPFFSFLKRKEVGPLQYFDDTKLGLLGELFKFVEYTDNSVIFKQGDVSDAFYLIIRGTCNVISHDDQENEVVMAELGPFDLAGEISLMFETKRTASVVVTSTLCVCLKLNRSDFQRFLKVAPEIEYALGKVIAERVSDRLSRIPFFQGIKENKPWSKINMLGSLFCFENQDAGTKLFKQGDFGDKYYIICTGKVELTLDVEDQFDNTHTIALNALSQNDAFGEIALLESECRMCTATCVENCLLLSVTKKKFKQFLSIAPELLPHFTQMLYKRTADTLSRLPFFRNIKENKPWSKLEILASIFHFDFFQKGETVFQVGEEGDKFYIIIAGVVSVEINNTSVCELRANDYFGELALLEMKPRSATIKVLKNVIALRLSGTEFRKFLNLAPEFGILINEKIKDRRNSCVDLEAIQRALKDVEENKQE